MALIVGLVLAAGFLLHAPVTATAYTGGPVRAEIAGYEPERKRVYFRLVAHDESYAPPKVYFFDLEGKHPAAARRDRTVEPRDTLSDVRETPSWFALRRRLVPLIPEGRVSLGLEVEAESTGVDSVWEVPKISVRVAIAERDRRHEFDLVAYCSPTIGIRGIWGVPGRPERILVLTTTGRAYGCEEVERPCLLP